MNENGISDHGLLLGALRSSQEFTEGYSSEHCKYFTDWAKGFLFLKYKRRFG